jgi:hypothetical protein
MILQNYYVPHISPDTNNDTAALSGLIDRPLPFRCVSRVQRSTYTLVKDRGSRLSLQPRSLRFICPALPASCLAVAFVIFEPLFANMFAVSLYDNIRPSAARSQTVRAFKTARYSTSSHPGTRVTINEY